MKKIILALFFIITAVAFAEIKTISVTGSATLSVKPDTVVINTGVNSANPDIGIAIDENSTIMASILEGLSKLGIDEDSVQTNNYNVYHYKPYDKNSDEIPEYRVSNTIEIRTKKVELVNRVLDTVITLGANEINGIRFIANPDEENEKELRKLAMEDAREKATFLADLEGMKIEHVLSIIESGSKLPPENLRFGVVMEAKSKSSVTSGSETISASYTVIYKIEAK